MKATLLLACLSGPLTVLLPGTFLGQAAGPSGGPVFETVEGSFFALSVADLEASVRWYEEKLDLHVVIDVPKTEGVAVTVLQGHGLTVELIEHDAAVPRSSLTPPVTEPQLLHGITKVGIVVENFDEVVALLRARGVEADYGPFPAHDGQPENVLIRDNAGNLIQFFGR